MVSVPLKQVAGVAGACLALAAPAWAGERAGDARLVLAQEAGNHPEGITTGRHGVVYLGNRRDDGVGFVSEVLAIARDGSVSTLAVLARLDRDDPGSDGVLGLTTDRRGDVYAAVVAPDPATHGVWRIARDGSRRERLGGSELMTFPNALAFDLRGNLYATDSFGGAIWRFPRRHAAHGAGQPWAQHELLAPAADDPLGFPLPGVNGLAFAAPNRLYAANTEKGLIVEVPIDLADGTPGEPRLVASGPDLATVDGVAADRRGALHAVIPGHGILGTAPLVRVDPETGVVTPGVGPAAWDVFDVPLSLTVVRSHRRTIVLATNGDLPGIPPEHRKPGIVAVRTAKG
jgi:hypothetical protein